MCAFICTQRHVLGWLASSKPQQPPCLSPLPTVLGSIAGAHSHAQISTQCWGFELRSSSLQSKHYYPLKHPSSCNLPNFMPLTNIVKHTQQQHCDNMHVGCFPNFPAEKLGPSRWVLPCSQNWSSTTDDTLLGTWENITKC